MPHKLCFCLFSVFRCSIAVQKIVISGCTQQTAQKNIQQKGQNKG